MELFPDHSSTLLKYAGFVRHVKKDRKLAELFYKKAVEANPKSADALGNYASFLHGQADMMPTCYDLCKCVCPMVLCLSSSSC